jgi:Zn-dependent protease
MEFASLIIYFVIIVPSAIIHEVFHGWTANYFGDPTAKYAGRLTLNPIPHIDLWGTILMPVVLFLGSGGSLMFAYAKPVPINPLYMRGKWAVPIVAAAGPFANFLTAAVIGAIVRGLGPSTFTSVLEIIVAANIGLGLFNLIPIPPLDGSKVLFAFFPRSWQNFLEPLERYGFVILLVVMLSGISFLGPLVQQLFILFTGHMVGW